MSDTESPHREVLPTSSNIRMAMIKVAKLAKMDQSFKPILGKLQELFLEAKDREAQESDLDSLIEKLAA